MKRMDEPQARLRRNVRRGAALLLAAVAIVLTLAAGCGPKPGGGATGGRAQGGGAIGGRTLRVGVVLDKGGPDDESFNAAAIEGVERAKRELGVEERYLESQDASDYKTNLTTFAGQGYDVVFAVGYAMEDAVKEVAPQFPDVKFAIVDGNAPAGQPNTAALLFREEQGCFLAGFLAASVSKTKTIGFVGGQDIPLIQKFEAGYRAGAKAADPAVRVVSAYTNNWEDVSKGKNDAQQEFGNGADVIFHAAGKCGLGVIQAAQERGPGYYAIGVDRDQDYKAPGRVLTSMIKKTDVAVFDTCKRVKEGRFQPGPQMYDLKSGGVGLSEMKFTRKQIPQVVLDRLARAQKLVESGSIAVPTTVDGVAKFRPGRIDP
jgi:basic membrane protein A